MKNVRMWMISFKDTKTFSDAFLNTNCHFKTNQLWVWVWCLYSKRHGTLQHFPSWWAITSTYGGDVLYVGPRRSMPGCPGTGPCPGNCAPSGGPRKSHIGPPPSLPSDVEEAWIQERRNSLPCPALKPWILSWNHISTTKPRLRIPMTVFHSTSARLIPRNPPLPFRMSMAVYQLHSSTNVPSWKAAWMMETTFTYFFGSGVSSHVAAWSHDWRFYARITDGPSKQLGRIWRTTQSTSSLSGTESNKGKRVATTGIINPGGGGLHVGITPHTL